ncbi:GLPGLI family protein [Mucilaginibacter mali]|uniref:GLPGLI family protein n=1 Tax=Mucilaginibacter mali TaxID=2740462 RepID=A0A7D4UD32_9SPHI|nr:GLPGLI family protein [Mucilaginibacter mali]QKJ32238.1 GLPGLI family protein [Mucilaginibacter mali]
MKKISIAIICILTCFSGVFAQQARFTVNGTIEFDKTVNAYALIRKGQITGKFASGNERDLLEQYQVSNPQFKTLKSTLSFAGNKTLFTPVDRSSVKGQGFEIPSSAQNNIVYTDHTAGTVTIQKDIMGDNFLLSDSTRKIKWKITGETREIAGYPCRRANGLMMDSIYVVAFFTEKIHVQGGPESFDGLPGMILEVALPHDNITWKATKVTDMVIATDVVKPPKTGKKVDATGLMEVLKGITNNRPPAQAGVIMKAYLL